MIKYTNFKTNKSKIKKIKKLYIDQEWLKLAQKRIVELNNNEVIPVSWNYLKQKVRNAKD